MPEFGPLRKRPGEGERDGVGCPEQPPEDLDRHPVLDRDHVRKAKVLVDEALTQARVVSVDRDIHLREVVEDGHGRPQAPRRIAHVGPNV